MERIQLRLLRPRGFWIVVKEGLRKMHIRMRGCLALGMRTQKAMGCPHGVLAPLVENHKTMRTAPTAPQIPGAGLIKCLQSYKKVDNTKWIIPSG